jgi:hypothetical protein
MKSCSIFNFLRPLAARYIGSQDPVPGRCPAVEKHYLTTCLARHRISLFVELREIIIIIESAVPLGT